MNGHNNNGRRVFFYPPVIETKNQYTKLMQSAITQLGYVLYRGELRRAVFCCDIFHFNWYDELWSKYPPKKAASYLYKLLVLSFIKITGKKIIYAFHDKKSHDKSSRMTMSIRRWFLKHSDKVIIHCTESIAAAKEILPEIDTSKIVYVPHPNYITAYTDTQPYTKYSRKDGEIILSFIGQLRPYKCLEVLIEAANQLQNIAGIHFLICGDGSDDYKKKLLAMTRGKNITLDFRFIEDDEMPSLMKMSDAVLLPYNTTSEMNSVASYLAFSFGRTVIGTWTGTTRDLTDKSLVYCYDYTDDYGEHVSRLKDAILRFCEDFRNDESATKHKGNVLLEIMKENNSVNATAKALSKVYE